MARFPSRALAPLSIGDLFLWPDLVWLVAVVGLLPWVLRRPAKTS